LIVRQAKRFPSTRQYPTGKFLDQAIKLSVIRNGITSTSTNFDLEIFDTKTSIRPPTDDPDGHYGPIRSLVVCLKTPVTLQALSQLKHRISPSSVIALLQNGMGVYDELCTEVWPDPLTRPFFILGTTTHGVTATERKGEAIHMSKSGDGDIKWGLVQDPRNEVDLEQWVYGKRVSDASMLSPPASPALPLPNPPRTDIDLGNVRDTLSALLSLSELNSTLLPMPQLHHTLLLKVALNATINPLTAVIGAGSLPNGSLIGSSPSHRLIRMLSAETSSIITAYLSSLYAPNAPPPDTLRLYTAESLTSRTLALCRATSGNTSSMAADSSAGRMTEIDHITGYLISLANRVGVPAPHHLMLREMVKFSTEVTGLRNDTSLGTRTRLTRRKLDLSGKIMDTHTRQLLLEEHKLNRQLRSENRRSKSATKKGFRSKRRQLGAAGQAEGENQDKMEGRDEDKTRKNDSFAKRLLSKRNRVEVAAEPEQSNDMLAHLDTLVKSVRSEEKAEHYPPVASEQEKGSGEVGKDSHGEQGGEKPSEAEDEAIRALEDRILGGSRGFGSRRY
jgi:2-dehydropantoate 2-reductase